ncbi:hypothetical protein GIB67_000288 [Kingdonia uniflora]|uniref:Replication protein A 70 kDa DNA-binding subunit B/D first OB fold domain-containing protein n=1 Tax=Kingdonia uniflora TaxID=39325 RepID=A0A7J7LCH5_9MAGN|nr:hypothetical protein GIB67_000288 [Kingdonia uniflora]
MTDVRLKRISNFICREQVSDLEFTKGYIYVRVSNIVQNIDSNDIMLITNFEGYENYMVPITFNSLLNESDHNEVISEHHSVIENLNLFNCDDFWVTNSFQILEYSLYAARLTLLEKASELVVILDIEVLAISTHDAVVHELELEYNPIVLLDTEDCVEIDNTSIINSYICFEPVDDGVAVTTDKVNMVTKSYNLIENVNHTIDRWKIKVRISRMWYTYDFIDTKGINRIEMLLINEKGDQMHAIFYKKLVSSYDKTLHEDVIEKLHAISEIKNCNKDDGRSFRRKDIMIKEEMFV